LVKENSEEKRNVSMKKQTANKGKPKLSIDILIRFEKKVNTEIKHVTVNVVLSTLLCKTSLKLPERKFLESVSIY
jgi:hypothetical protein